MAKSKEDIIEEVRQAMWHWLHENPTTISAVAKEMRIDRITLTSFVYAERISDMRTVMRVKQFLKEKYEERDRDIAERVPRG